MRLKIKTLPFGTHAVECHLDESFFNTDEQTEVRRASVDVTLQVTRKSENTYHLEIACNGTLTTACDRCLDDLDLPVDVNYSLDVEQMGNELDDSNDELLIVPAEWRELDAAPLVRDTVTPATVTEPESISSRQFMQRRKVDFPQPEGPIIDARSPSRIVKLIFLRTSASS